jgi:CubicO group peptidase (beta-lactamase class C family)
MAFLRSFVCLILLAVALPCFAADTAAIDMLVSEAMGRNLVAGAVVLVGNRDGVLFERAWGRSASGPESRPMTVDTLFDIASLTKVVATTPAILKLAEEGKLSLLDSLVRWFPEFSGHGKTSILVLNLLTHTSGLDDFPISGANPLSSAIEGAALQQVKGEVGSRFRYADLNFILLAELVRRASGTGLDQYTQASFYRPLGMTDTGFNPRDKSRCSSTIGDGRIFTGEPQDFPARQLGGVAGHAGLFSTARDLGAFCRMMLASGALGGKRVLNPRTVDQMTAPYFSRGGEVVRGLGWDIASPYSSPRGLGFSRLSFGHTGYSGSSIWIDPASDTFVVLLSARLDYKNIHDFNRFRGDISTLAAQLFGQAPKPGDLALSADE